MVKAIEWRLVLPKDPDGKLPADLSPVSTETYWMRSTIVEYTPKEKNMELPNNPTLADRLRFAAQVIEQVTPLIAPLSGLISADNLRNQAAREERAAEEVAKEGALFDELAHNIEEAVKNWNGIRSEPKQWKEPFKLSMSQYIAKSLTDLGWRKPE